MVAGDLALAGAERIALPGQDPVAEALREVEQTVGVGHERAVAAVSPGVGGTREEFGERPGEGDRGNGRAAAYQNLSSCCVLS